MKKTVLIVVHTNTWFTEMYRVAELLLRSNRFKPIIHFAYRYPTSEADSAKLKQNGIEFAESQMAFQNQYMLEKIIAKFLDIFFRIIRSGRFVFITRHFSFAFLVLDSAIKSISEIFFYRKIIRSTHADLIVLAGDLVGYSTPEIVRAAHSEKKPCIIIPSTMSDGTEQAEAYFFDSNYSCDKFFNRLAGRLWPKWKKLHKGKWMTRLPADQLYAKQLLGLAPPLPWVSSSTRADAIAVESRAMKDYYLRCGIEASLLRETGTLANDYLANAMKNRQVLKSKLTRDLGLDLNKKIILTALPPDSLYMTGGRPECEFKTYKELTTFWIRTLSQADQFNIVVSLHPSVDIEDFRYLESHNVKISKLSIVDVIPLCDVFVASVSSTIRWAIACSKPVVNYDVYLYRYVDFSGVKGVVYLDLSKQFLKTILKINNDKNYLEFLNKEIQTEASYWGTLDGHEGSRILQLFDKMVKKTTDL